MPDAPAMPRAKPPRPRRFTWRVAVFLVLIVAVLGVGAASFAWYGRSAYFVQLDGDALSIFKGRPGGFLWFEPTKVKSNVLPLSQVPPAKLDEVKSGKVESSLAGADRYVNNLRDQTTTTVPPVPPVPPAGTTPPPA